MPFACWMAGAKGVHWNFRPRRAGVTMRITDDCAVSLHFVLKDEHGRILSASTEDVPFSYLHGHNQMLPALERALRDRLPGETVHLILPPEDAYGMPDEHNRAILSRQEFSDDELAVGRRVYIMGEQGPKLATILSYDAANVVCDTNHEWAGKTLEFEVRIGKVRQATFYELGCGHVHDTDEGGK